MRTKDSNNGLFYTRKFDIGYNISRCREKKLGLSINKESGITCNPKVSSTNDLYLITLFAYIIMIT